MYTNIKKFGIYRLYIFFILLFSEDALIEQKWQ